MDKKMRNFHKNLAEYIGTFALVFAGCGSIMISDQFPEDLPRQQIPLVFGLIVSAMIYSLGHISGAHFNPAVTVAFAVARHFPAKDVLGYVTAQVLGAFSAILLLILILPYGQTFGETLPVIHHLQAFLWECILSFFLMFVIISVATDTRAVGVMAGVAIGATVTLCAMIGGPLTGASMNPARSIAPGVLHQEWGSLWIYLIAPFLGAIGGALTYEAIRCHNEKDRKPKGCC